jgi:hypothetical protein
MSMPLCEFGVAAEIGLLWHMSVQQSAVPTQNAPMTITIDSIGQGSLQLPSHIATCDK